MESHLQKYRENRRNKCCEHWSAGMTKYDNNDLPNLTVPSTQITIIEKIYQKAKKIN